MAPERNSRFRCGVSGYSLKETPTGASGRSINNLEPIFFDDGIGEHFFGYFFEVLMSFVTIPAIEIEDEEFALADIFNFGVAKAGERVLNGLALRIENGALWHDPNVCFHAPIITSPPTVHGW